MGTELSTPSSTTFSLLPTRLHRHAPGQFQVVCITFQLKSTSQYLDMMAKRGCRLARAVRAVFEERIQEQSFHTNTPMQVYSSQSHAFIHAYIFIVATNRHKMKQSRRRCWDQSQYWASKSTLSTPWIHGASHSLDEHHPVHARLSHPSLISFFFPFCQDLFSLSDSAMGKFSYTASFWCLVMAPARWQTSYS